MAKYSVKVEVRNRKLPSIELIEEYEEHDKAAHSYGLWKALVAIPNSNVLWACLIQHREETVVDKTSKIAKPPALPVRERETFRVNVGESANVNG